MSFTIHFYLLKRQITYKDLLSVKLPFLKFPSLETEWTFSNKHRDRTWVESRCQLEIRKGYLLVVKPRSATNLLDRSPKTEYKIIKVNNTTK